MKTHLGHQHLATLKTKPNFGLVASHIHLHAEFSSHSASLDRQHKFCYCFAQRKSLKMPRKAIKRGVFKAGHQFYAPYSSKMVTTTALSTWGPRLSQAEFDRVAKPSPCGQLYRVSDAEGQYGTTNLLRPRKVKAPCRTEEYLQRQDESTSSGEMRLMSKGKLSDMWNEARLQHDQYPGRCDNQHLSFCEDSELQKGLCWKETLKCDNCGYIGIRHKLYDEVPSVSRGAKTAAPNLGWQVGLQESSMGNTRSRVVLAAANIPPPSRKAMNRAAAKVCDITSAAIEQELCKERLKLKETNKMRGLAEDAPINISIDGRYNSTVIASRNKAGQNASQAISIAVEHQTAQKKVVAAYMDNKLCWTGSWLRNRGFAVDCPGGHEGCTATIAAAEPLSELRMGEKIGDMFADEQVMVKYVTTDGDARTAEGVQAAMKKLFPDWEVIRKADPVHIGQSQIRETMKSQFSDEMFSGRTREEKKEQQKTLALDIKNRSHAIFTKLFQETGGNMPQVSRRMHWVLDATIDCYSGDCKRCRKHSVVCNGGKKNNWWLKSCYLNTGVLRRDMLTPTKEDRQLLRELLRIRLGEAALLLLDQNTNTCKNEAINRSLSATMPKNVNWARTGRGRMLATCDRINKGIGESLLYKLEVVGAPVTKGGAVARAVRQLQHEGEYKKQYRKRADVRRRQTQARFTQRREHHAAKMARKSCRDSRGAYLKGQLDPQVDRRRLQAQRRLQTEQRRRLRQAQQASRSGRGGRRGALRGRTADHTYAYNFRRRTDHTYAQ